MIWLTLRQARRELLLLLGLYGVVLAFLFVTGMRIHAEVAHAMALHCYSQPIENAACSQLDLFHNWGWLEGLTPWLGTLPACFGFLVAAPLISQEAEQGTLRLIWTQSVTRRQWAMGKIGICAGLILIMAAGIQVMMLWWNAPFAAISTRLAQPIYDFEGILPYCLALAGFATGIWSGAWLGRIVPAVALALGSYLTLWLGLDTNVRFQFIPTLMNYNPDVFEIPTDSHTYLLDQGWTDAQHHVIDSAVVFKACVQPDHVNQDFAQCVHDHAWLFYVRYISESYLGRMQAVEGSIILAVAVLCLALAWRGILRMRL